MIEFSNCNCSVEKGKFSINDIPLDCPAVWRLISCGHTVGVFQLEKNLGQDWSKKVKPNSIDELAALVSLLRPGPLECLSGDTQITKGQFYYKKSKQNRFFYVTMKDLYRKFLSWEKSKHKGKAQKGLSILSIDEDTGEILKNTIKRVVNTGKQKIYKLKLKLTLSRYNQKIKRFYVPKATDGHKFLTQDGWKELKEICPGDYIAVINQNFGRIDRKDRTTIEGLKIFRDICLFNYKYKCLFCNWSLGTLDVNHIKGNRYTNNNPDNLCFLCPNHHRMYTEGTITRDYIQQKLPNVKLSNKNNIRWVLYEGKEDCGEEETYDIAVDGPNHNYIASNVVVHNSGMTQNYVDIKFGRKKNSYLHPALKPILEPTFGCLVYQEQAIRIATDIAGLSPESADELRKAIGKKKPELMAKVKAKFVKGAQEYGKIGRGVAEEIFGWIEKCQRYCVSGDTIIRRPNDGRFLKSCGYSIEHMYHIRHDIRYAKQHGHTTLRRKWMRLGHYGKGLSLCDDGRIRPNIIRDIQSAGIMNIYKITLENGATIKATANHKFPTPKGEKTLGQLIVGDNLYSCGIYEQSDFKSINRFSNESKCEPRKYGHQCGFPFGAKNPCYTNGSYTNFMQYKININNTCEQCGKTDCRIETAHINGDRTNSKPENLKKLCVSCHKKHDYSNGRVRRGGKGYPVEIIKIKSIELCDVEEVWNVTMDAPNHNFVISNNIITSNSFNKSHAISYGMIAYQTAWLKCHFPHEFFTSYLTYSQYKGDPKEEIYKLVQDARFFGVDILPPDIRRGNIHFEMTKEPQKSVAFGLAHIRGVGASAIEKIVLATSTALGMDPLDESVMNHGGNASCTAKTSAAESISNGVGKTPHCLKTWADFLAAVPDFHRNVGIALIKSGACDCYEMQRSEMVRELEVVLGTSVRNSLGKKVEIKGLTNKEKIYFFGQLRQGIMTTQEILLQMTHPPGGKTKTIGQMTKKELVAASVEYLNQVDTAFDGIEDGDSKFVYTSPKEKETWLDNLGNRTKKKIEELMLQNGYKDVVVKPPCSSDARRRIVASKSEMLEEPLNDTNTVKATAEKHFLGIALSCSQADDADDTLATHNCLEVARAPNKECIAVCAIIDSVKHTKTKRGDNPGQPMCFLTISDSTYSIDHTVVFPDTFCRVKAFCKDDMICLIYGEKRNGSFIIRDIQKLM